MYLIILPVLVAEVGSAVDLPVETSSLLALAAEFQPSILRDIVSLPPVKVLQAAVELLVGTGHAKESVDPTPAGGATPRVALSSLIPNV